MISFKLTYFLYLELIEVCINDLEVNNCKLILKSFKRIFSESDSEFKKLRLINLNKIKPNNELETCLCENTSKESLTDFVFCSKSEKIKINANELLQNWTQKLSESNSSFLNQLLFFCLSINPNLWTEETLKLVEKYYKKIIQNQQTIEMALNSWILLLKSSTKIKTGLKPIITNGEAQVLVTESDSDGFGLDFLNFFSKITEKVEKSFEKYRDSEMDLIWERILGTAQLICNSEDNNDETICKFIRRAIEDLNDFK